MTKRSIVQRIAKEHNIKLSTAVRFLHSLADIGAKELTNTGKFIIPGCVMIKRRTQPATKAHKKEIFGKMYDIKARPARTVVKAFPASCLKFCFV